MVKQYRKNYTALEKTKNINTKLPLMLVDIYFVENFSKLRYTLKSVYLYQITLIAFYTRLDLNIFDLKPYYTKT